MELQSKDNKEKNKGYSLIELVIVIAIIALLTGLSFVTVSLLGSARAKEAAVDFDSQISDLASNAKSRLVVLNGEQYPSYCFCIKLYKEGKKYYIKKGYFNESAVMYTEQILSPGDDVSVVSKYIFVEGENANDDKGIGISGKVKIKYEAPSQAETEITEDGIYIIFNRSGRCISGNGVYHFYKKSNNANIANVTINKNGSHQSK